MEKKISLLWEMQVLDGMCLLGLSQYDPTELISYTLLTKVDEAYKRYMYNATRILKEPDMDNYDDYRHAHGAADELFSFTGAVIRNEVIATRMPEFNTLWHTNWQGFMKAWLETEVIYWTEMRDNEAETSDERSRYQGCLDALAWLKDILTAC